jgi:hypothetical protein
MGYQKLFPHRPERPPSASLRESTRSVFAAESDVVRVDVPNGEKEKEKEKEKENKKTLLVAAVAR